VVGDQARRRGGRSDDTDNRDVGGCSMDFVDGCLVYFFLSTLIMVHNILIYFYKFWSDP
jgi:hypothetical protein